MLPGRFEALLHASQAALSLEFQRFPVEARSDTVESAEAAARTFSVNPTQLLCALAFNRTTRNVPRVWAALAYSCFEALQSRANYLFINDCYRFLTIDNVLDLYAEIVQHADAPAWVPDLVLDRLAFIEQQIEETINPVMIGSYKLEMRAIYEDGIADPSFIDARLKESDAALRGLGTEVALMVEHGLLTPREALWRPTVSLEEKQYLLRLRVVDPEVIRERLGAADLADAERRFLEAALPPPRAS
jgi:hypothetical protein